MSVDEYGTLEWLLSTSNRWLSEKVKERLERIVRPIEDALHYIGAHQDICQQTLQLLLREMYRRGTTFWAWSLEEWEESFCPNTHLFAQRYGRANPRSLARRHLPVVAYLLQVHPERQRFIEMIEIVPLAQDVFGKEAVEQALQAPFALLQSWGYSLKERQNPTASLCYLLLRNGSPYLEHLSFAFLEEVSHTCPLTCVQQTLFRLSRALHALGIIERPLPDARFELSQAPSSHEDIAPEWLASCQRWRATSPLQCAEHDYYQLLKVGRWRKRAPSRGGESG